MFINPQTGRAYTPKVSSLEGMHSLLDDEPATNQNIVIRSLEKEVSRLKRDMDDTAKAKSAAERKIAILEEKVSALEAKVSVLISILGNQDEEHSRKSVRVKARHVRKQKADS